MKINSILNVLKLAAVISVMALASQAQAEGEVYTFISKMRGTSLLNYAFDRTADCSNKEQVIATFKDKHKICFESQIWKTTAGIKEHLPKLLEGADGGHLFILFYYINRFSGRPSGTDFVITNLSNWQRFLGLFTSKTLELLPDDAISPPLVAPLMMVMKPEHTQYMKPELINAALGATKDAHSARKILNSIHPNVVKEMINEITTFLGTHYIGKQVHLGGLSDAILKNLLSPEYCGQIDAKSFLSLGERLNQAALLTAECMAEVDWSSVKCDRRVRAFKPGAFRLSNGPMDETCLRLLTRPMVEGYGEAREDGERCGQLAIEKLNSAAIRGVSSKCLIQRLSENDVENASFSLDGLWPLLPTDVFSQLGGNESVLEKIAEEDYGKMTLAQKVFITKSPEACKFLPPHFFLENGDFFVDQPCFDELKPEVQAAATVHGRLPDMALAKLDSLKSWRLPMNAPGSQGDVVEGIRVLEFIRAPNAGKLIANLSASNPDHNACEDIESLSMLAEMPFFQEHCSEACVKALGEKPKLSTLKEVDERIANMVPLEDLLADMGTSDWQNLQVEDFRKLLRNAEFCKGLKGEQINAFNKSCLEAIDATCAAAITTWDEVQATTVQEMKPEAFRKFTKLLAATLGTEKLSDGQFAELGAEMSQDNHPADVWTKDYIAALKPSRLAAIKKETWKMVHSGAFAGLTTDQLRTIKPENMVYWNAQQVAAVIKEHWSVLSQEQAKEIGSAAAGTESPLSLLAEAPLGETALQAIKERQKPAPEAAEKKVEETKKS